jgi:hypothetical protein
MSVVFTVRDAGAASALLQRYDGRPWSESRDDRVCRLERVPTMPVEPACEAAAAALSRDRFKTRAERRRELCEALAAPALCSVGAPLELSPPDFLPRGDVGSSNFELRAALDTAKLSARDLRSLGLDTSLASIAASAARPNAPHAAEPGAYVSGFAVRGGRGLARTAAYSERVCGGPVRAGGSVCELREAARRRLAAQGRGNALDALGLLGPRASGARGDELLERLEEWPPADADADDAQEWDRHEAITEAGAWEANDRPTSAYWNSGNAHLFEEEISHTWEKGGSGLAFYTDEAFWHARTHADERLTDGWDTHDVDEDARHDGDDGGDGGGGGGGGGSPEAVDDRPPRARIARVRSRPAGGGGIGAAHAPAAGRALDASTCSGFRLLEKMGWSAAQPGLGKRAHGAELPLAVQLASHVKHDRRGLGAVSSAR